VEIATENLPMEAAHKLLVGAVVPRPIAWVTSLSTSGAVNLAPFSFYTVLSLRPMMLGINIGRRQGKLKDTARNIAERGEFVVNVCVESMVEQVHRSGNHYPENVSEAEILGLDLSPSLTVVVPRLSQSPISMECVRVQALEFGEEQAGFIVGAVKHVYVRDDLYRNGKIDTAQLRPLSRVAGPAYAGLGELIYMKPGNV
jgi:flavin reductase (DIM6/NTAB) family NADH-FMN oxidoreductase RutF